MTEMEIASVKVGNRFRKDLGDIESLKKSIALVGLLQPIVVRSDGKLVAGARRLAAMEQLGHTTIPVKVMDSLDSAILMLSAEQDENRCRKDFTPSEAVALARVLEDLERPKAEERKKQDGGRPRQKTCADSPQVSVKRRKSTREKVSAAVGMGHRKLKEASAVVAAAADGVPGAAEVLAEMDATGNVHGAYMVLQGKTKTKRQDAIEKANDGRLAKAIGRIEGSCRGLMRMNLQAALKRVSEDDLKAYRDVIDGCMKTLRQVRSQLQ